MSGAVSISCVAGAWKCARKNGHARDILFSRVPQSSRTPHFFSYFFQAPATQHKVRRGRVIYAELGDVCMQADTLIKFLHGLMLLRTNQET